MAFILVVISLFSPKTPIALAAVVFLGVASITILQTLTIDSMVLIVATNTVKFLETGKALVTTQLGPGSSTPFLHWSRTKPFFTLIPSETDFPLRLSNRLLDQFSLLHPSRSQPHRSNLQEMV